MFYEKLKELRLKGNMTQEELAQKLFVTRNAVSKWETNKGYPNIDTLNDIANLFQVSLDDLIHDGDVKRITLENAKAISHQQDYLKSGIIFFLYALLGTLFPYLLFTYDSSSVMVYFCILGPISYLFIALISSFICRKKVNVIIASLLGIIPTYMFFDMFTHISLSYYEIIYWCLYIVAYLLLLKITSLSYSIKTLKVLKITFLILCLLFTLLFILLSIVSIINYKDYFSAPWYVSTLVYFLIFVVPISLTFILYLYFYNKEKVILKENQ